MKRHKFKQGDIVILSDIYLQNWLNTDPDTKIVKSFVFEIIDKRPDPKYGPKYGEDVYTVKLIQPQIPRARQILKTVTGNTNEWASIYLTKISTTKEQVKAIKDIRGLISI